MIEFRRVLTRLLLTTCPVTSKRFIYKTFTSSPGVVTPNLDLDYLCHDTNTETIATNIRNRQSDGDINRVKKLHSQWSQETNPSLKTKIYDELIQEAARIPNHTHLNSPVGEEDKAVLVDTIGRRREFEFKPRGVVDLGEWLGHLRCYNTTVTSGPRTYYFMDAFARLERALVRYTLNRIIEKGFRLISVPDIVGSSAIESAGFKTTGQRTQVYRLESEKDEDVLCLSGTGEMGLVGYLMNECLDFDQLPLKYVTASRCYRAETSNVKEETGIYRVHQFTKVEMFGVTANETGEESQELFHEIISIQKELFRDLGLHFRILNMPTAELGAPAYCKYDYETWMPDKGFWGEITSTSNCTDFQARRMNLTYSRRHTERTPVKKHHCHTVNGTGCAVPRTIMAIVENFQNDDGTISIPEVLRPYMNNDSLITISSQTPRPRWIKSKKR